MPAEAAGRRAAQQAAALANDLDRFLQARGRGVGETAASNQTTPAGPATLPVRAVEIWPQPVLRAVAPLRMAHTDWLFHHFTVTGPLAALGAFAVAAAGACTVPWVLDFDQLEEDWFHRLMAPAGRSLSLAGAKILAGQIRQAAEHRHDLAVARVGHSRACPFDLHSLVPVPMEILVLGPDQPASLTWLWAHWGTTEPLLHVVVDNRPSRRETPDLGLKFSFWSADWSPWRAVERLRVDWPTLSFDLQPRYDRA